MQKKPKIKIPWKRINFRAGIFWKRSALIGAAGLAGISALNSCSNKSKSVDYAFPPLLNKPPMERNYAPDWLAAETEERVLPSIFWLRETIWNWLPWPMFLRIRFGTAIPNLKNKKL
jgi:hypothetical protein